MKHGPPDRIRGLRAGGFDGDQELLALLIIGHDAGFVFRDSMDGEDRVVERVRPEVHALDLEHLVESIDATGDEVDTRALARASAGDLDAIARGEANQRRRLRREGRDAQLSELAHANRFTGDRVDHLIQGVVGQCMKRASAASGRRGAQLAAPRDRALGTTVLLEDAGAPSVAEAADPIFSPAFAREDQALNAERAGIRPGLGHHARKSMKV